MTEYSEEHIREFSGWRYRGINTRDDGQLEALLEDRNFADELRAER